MKQKNNILNLRGIDFQKISEKTFSAIDISDLNFFIISRSGLIDKPGNIYLFTSNTAFFMAKPAYSERFINKFLSNANIKKWNTINLYFCDDLYINPKIYDSFTKELCARNIRDFWFETTIDIFKDRAWL